MAGRPSPSGMRCHDAYGGGFEIATNAALSHEDFESLESHKHDIRATFSGRGKFQPSFFLPLFGPGKIPGEAFFCHCFGKPCRRGGCWGCAMSASACVGTLTGGRTRQSASERCGWGVAPRGVRCSSPASYFFGYGSLESLPLFPIDCDGVSSRRAEALRFAASLRPPLWLRPWPR